MKKILTTIAWTLGFTGMAIELPIKALALIALVLVNIIYVILYPIIKNSRFFIVIKSNLKDYIHMTPWYIASKLYELYAN